MIDKGVYQSIVGRVASRKVISREDKAHADYEGFTMKYRIQGFTVYGKYVDTIRGFPNDSDDMYHNQFRITVQKDKVRRTFNYYGSQHDYEQGKIELDRTDLKDCLYSFFSDALAGMQNFEDFCSEFGYNTDSRKAEKIYKLCQKSTQKALDLGLIENDLVDLVNILNN